MSVLNPHFEVLIYPPPPRLLRYLHPYFSPPITLGIGFKPNAAEHAPEDSEAIFIYTTRTTPGRAVAVYHRKG